MPAMVIGIASSIGRGETGADHDVGRAALAIALERVAGDRGAEEHKIVEGRQPPFGPEAPDVVQAFARGARISAMTLCGKLADSQRARIDRHAAS